MSCSICFFDVINIWLVFELLLDGIFWCFCCKFLGFYLSNFLRLIFHISVSVVAWDVTVLYFAYLFYICIACTWYNIWIWFLKCIWLFSLLQCFLFDCFWFVLLLNFLNLFWCTRHFVFISLFLIVSSIIKRSSLSVTFSDLLQFFFVICLLCAIVLAQ